MDTDYRVGADVDGTDGLLGKLRQLVFDPATSSVTHLVVELEEHFGIPVLVPIDQVEMADQEHIRLRCSRAAMQQMEPFEQVMTSGGPDEQPLMGLNPLSPGASGLGMAPMGGMIGPLGGAPMMMPIMEERVPSGEVVIGRDATVEAVDGEVGHVEEVITDPTSGRLTHLVIRSGHLWATSTFRILADAVDRVEEGNVRLNLTKDEVETLAREGEEGEASSEEGDPVRLAGGAGSELAAGNVAEPVTRLPGRVVRPPTGNNAG